MPSRTPKKRRTTPSAYQKRKQERDQCTARLTTVEEVVRVQTEELHQARQQLATTQSHVDMHQQRHAAVQLQFQAEQQALQQLQQRMNETEAERRRLEHMEASLTKQVTTHVTQAEERMKAMADLQGQHKEVQQALQDGSQALAESQLNREELQRQLASLQSERDLIRDQHQQLQQEHAMALAEHKSVQSQLARVQEKLEQCMQELSELHDQNDRMAESVQAMGKLVNETNQELATATSQLAICKTQVDELNMTLQGKDTELGSLHAEKERLVADIRRLQAEQETLQQQVESQRHQVNLCAMERTSDQHRFQVEMSNKEAELVARLAQLTEEHEQTRHRLQSEHEQTHQQLQEQHKHDQGRFQLEINNKEVELVKRVSELTEEYEQIKARLQAELRETNEKLVESNFVEQSCQSQRHLDQQRYESEKEISTFAHTRELTDQRNQISQQDQQIQFLNLELSHLREQESSLAKQLAGCETRFTDKERMSEAQLRELRDEITSIQAQQETCRSESMRLAGEKQQAERHFHSQLQEAETNKKTAIAGMRQTFQSEMDRMRQTSESELARQQLAATERLQLIENELRDKTQEHAALLEQHQAEFRALQQELSRTKSDEADQKRQVSELAQQHRTQMEAATASLTTIQDLQAQLTRYEELNRILTADQQRLTQQLQAKSSEYEAKVLQIEQSDRTVAEKTHEIEDAKYLFDQQLDTVKTQLAATHQTIVDEINSRYRQTHAQHELAQESLTQQLQALQMRFDAQTLEIDQCKARLSQEESSRTQAASVFQHATERSKRDIHAANQRVTEALAEIQAERLKTEAALQAKQKAEEANAALQQQIELILQARKDKLAAALAVATEPADSSPFYAKSTSPPPLNRK